LSTRPPLHGAVLIAGDEGPRAALAPLESGGAQRCNPASKASVLISGTSQSDSGFAIEAAARREAARAGIAVVCVEDFPGNFRDLDDAPTQLLVVEGEFSVRLYRQRIKRPPQMLVIPPARYDHLRQRSGCAVQRPPFSVLWAGQPETAACLATLEALREFLRTSRIELLFRAHPRDRGHAQGAYRELLSGLRHRDVSTAALSSVMNLPLRLVLTQYSSVAIEAGFLGVPSVCVLLPEAGERLLHEQKGYRVPMACDSGAAFFLNDRKAAGILETALNDDLARVAVMQRFRALYQTDTLQAPVLISQLAGIIS